MNEIIKVNYDSERPTVMGRELHEMLEVGTEYRHWFPRMCEYGFTENVDYIATVQKRPTAQGNETTYTDHQLTIEMAKEICMLQRSEKGKQARQCVYMHINKINGKRYFGITGQNFKRRWRDGTAYKHCTRFNNDISKYGWENFEHYILANNIGEYSAKILEQILVSRYKTYQNEHGYNISLGGGKWSEEMKEKLRSKRNGNDNPFYGKKHSAKTKHIIGENSKKFTRGKNSQAKKVMCLNTGEVFECMVSAAEKYGINCPSDISKVCKGKTKSRGKDKNGNKLRWAYV